MPTFAGPDDKPDPEVSQKAADAASANVGANYQGEDGQGYGNSANEYWCADFAIWCWTQAHANVTGLSAASVTFYEYGEFHRTLHMDSPQVGDAVVFNYDPNHVFDDGSVGPWSDHVAIVTKVDGNEIETVSGDWADSRTKQGQGVVAFARTSHVLLNAPEYPGTVGTTPGVIAMKLSGFITPVVPPPVIATPQPQRAVATVNGSSGLSIGPAASGPRLAAAASPPSWYGQAAAPDASWLGPAAAFSSYDSGSGAPQGGSQSSPQLHDAVMLAAAVRVPGVGSANQVTPASDDDSVTKREGVRSPFEAAPVDDSTQAAAFTLDTGPDNGVVAGPSQLLVAVAHPSCLHSGGQPVVTGSHSVFVGLEQSPLAGHGDETEDGGVIQDRTHEEIYLT